MRPLFVLLTFMCLLSKAQEAPKTFQNPILPGFNPDPSICRVGDDYYLATSSFLWFPAMPVYHSKDLVNGELIGHGISRPSQLNFDGLKDNNGVWAVTIRHHNGVFYLITTCNNCGGNFYITATNPAGPWSDPVWLKDAPGIDASLTWDDDDKCYYTGNDWGFKKSWPGQCALWAQELDLAHQKLVGERKVLTYGHANNASFAEGPHIYKINKDYLLLAAEGGTDTYHAITAHHSSTIFGDYKADKINPVLSHRQLGKDYPIQAVGHSDLVQTQNGEWWAVVLGKRLVDGEVPLSRETFLCKVVFENGSPIFNPGYGKVLTEQERPNLPWVPIKTEPARDEFSSNSLSLKWHTVRIPQKKFYNLSKGILSMPLHPQVADSLVHSSLLIQRIQHIQFWATTKLSFKSSKDNEQAGLIVYRTHECYYMLMKEKKRIALVKKSDGKKETVAEAPYDKPDVYLSVKGDRLNAQFSFGESLDRMNNIGEIQSLKIISESKINKFNGPGVGMYATSNGQMSKNKAFFDWFEYKYGN
jgi:alpha-N-arabinofuranosidase